MRGIRYSAFPVAAVVALLLSGTASAKCGHHKVTKGNSSVSVYVEQIPTSCGSSPAGSGGTGTVPLSARIERKLATKGPEGTVLRNIATSQALGAQPKTLHGQKLDMSGGGSSLMASLGALGGGNAVLLVILGVLTALAAVRLGTNIRRRRSAR